MKTKLTPKKPLDTDVKVQEKSKPSNQFGSDSIFGDHGRLFAPLQSLRQEIDEIFNQFNHRVGKIGRAEFPEFKVPATDVDETEDAIVISTELPGMDPKDIDVTIENSMLRIHGEREQSKSSGKAEHRVAERNYGVYERSLSLPFEVDAKKIVAEYNNGVLNLTIPKPAKVETKPQKIAIKSAA